MQRSTMQEAISAPTVGGIVRRTQFIIRTTILIEIIGAVLLAPVFLQGLWVLERNMVFIVPFYFCFLQCRI